jgi:hypothetical protein
MNASLNTRYILVGGGWKSALDKASPWQRMMIDRHDGPVRVLICLFGREQPVWDERFAHVKGLFEINLGPQALYELALPGTFMQQIEDSDVVYLDEGDNVCMEKSLVSYRSLSLAFAGKTVAGSSAGANILSQEYYTRSLSMVRAGMGILPIKVMTHYDSQPDSLHLIDWPAIRRELQADGIGTGHVYALRENEYVVLDQNGDETKTPTI